MIHSKTIQRLTRSAQAEDGMALLIAVVVLLLMSALGLAALQHAGDEASGSGNSRRKDATLYAADSGIKVIAGKLLASYVASPTMAPVNLDDPALVTDAYGNAIHVISGAPDYAAGGLPSAPASIGADPNNPGEPAEGFLLNQGNQATLLFKPVRADVTAQDIANDMVHLQAQFSVNEGSGGGAY